MLDLAIIGAGPAALSAAIYSARAGLRTKVFERKSYGGVLAEIPFLENYPGYVGAGQDLAKSMCRQSEQAGVQFSYGECLQISKKPDGSAFELMIDDEEVAARTVLIATGSEPKTLDFDVNVPVSYCALCDGALAQGKNIAVVGGANSAVQESIYLARLAQAVTIITRSKLKADQSLLDNLSKLSNIKVLEHTEPTADLLNQFDYCFVYVGKTPSTRFLARSVLDQEGYVICSKQTHQTEVKGLFAAGDVRAGTIKQVVTAAGDGAAAAVEIIRSIN